MPSIFTELENLRSETEAEEKELDRLCGDLGREAVGAGGSVWFPDDGGILAALLDAREAHRRSTEKLGRLKAAIDEINESGRKIEKVGKRLRELEEERLKLCSVLGAVVAEVSDAGQLPPELDFAMAPLRRHRALAADLERKASKAAFPPLGLLYSQRRKLLDRRLEGVYRSVGELVAGSGRTALLPGARASSVEIELSNIRKLCGSLDSELSRRRARLSEAKDSLAQQNFNVGVNNLRLREVEIETARLGDAARRKEEEYGAFLASNMGLWLGPSCPRPLAERCEAVARQKEAIRAKELQAQRLSFEKAIGICEGRIAQHEERLRSLDSRIDALEAQKRETQTRIETEKANIRSCRQRQDEIDRKLGRSDG